MRVTWPAPNRTFGIIDGLGLAGLVGLLVARYVPVAKLPFWGCYIRETTGWPCLGCGLTRVAENVSHGRIDVAWSVNPLGTVAALLFAVCIVASLLHLLFKVPLPDVQLSRGEARFARFALVVLVLVNYGFVVVKTRFPYVLS